MKSVMVNIPINCCLTESQRGQARTPGRSKSSTSLVRNIMLILMIKIIIIKKFKRILGNPNRRRGRAHNINNNNDNNNNNRALASDD